MRSIVINSQQEERKREFVYGDKLINRPHLYTN
jgi:hypothetical protein